METYLIAGIRTGSCRLHSTKTTGGSKTFTSIAAGLRCGSLLVKQIESYSAKAYRLWENLDCVPDSLSATVPSRRGHLKGPMWVEQKVAAVPQMETQLAQDEASRKTVGSNLGAGKVFHLR